MEQLPLFGNRMSLGKIQRPVKFVSLFIAVLFFFFSNSSAQTKYLSGNYWVEQYGKKEGLPESVVIDVMQDRKGFMWITTPYNLVRYDGYEFKVFNPRKEFPNIYIHFGPGLLEDTNGFIWIASFEKGLFCFDPRSGIFQRFTAGASTNSISSNIIVSIETDKKGNVWVATNNGLNQIIRTKDSFTVHQYSNSYVPRLFEIIDREAKAHPLFSGITKAGNLETRTDSFKIDKPTSLVVLCSGDYVNKWLDYGSIINQEGKVVWQISEVKALYSGGAESNKLQSEVITLPAGKYTVRFTSDDNHSYGNWINYEPTRTDLWGIHLYKFPKPITDSIALLIKASYIDNSNYGKVIKSLFKDSKGNIWSLTPTSVEKLNLPEARGGRITSEAILLPTKYFFPNAALEVDKDRIIIEGTFSDSVSRRSTRGSLIYSFITKKLQENKTTSAATTTYNSDAFLRDKFKNYWMATFSDGPGLLVSDSGSDLPEFRVLDVRPPTTKEPGKYAADQIWSIYEDRSGHIWIASRQNSLYKIKTRRSPVSLVEIRSATDNKKPERFLVIGEDEEGNIWLSGRDQPVYIYNRQTGSVKSFVGGKKPGSFIIFKGTNGDVTISKVGEATVYPNKQDPKSLPFHLPDSLILFAQDKWGNYWASHTRNNVFPGLFIQNGLNFHTVAFDSSTFEMGFYRKFHLGWNGNVWMAPPFKGLHRYKLDNTTKKLSFVKRYLPEGTDVYDIYEDSSGIVWLGTYEEGLIRFDPKTNGSKTFTRADGLPSNSVSKIVNLEDRLWIVTDLGSAFINLKGEKIYVNKELDEYISKQIPGFFASLPDFRGLANYIITTRLGEVAIASGNGFCIFNPDAIVTDTIRPLLHLSKVSFSGKAIELSNSDVQPLYKFRHFQNDVEINFIGLHYDQPAKNQYKYFLKGADKEWVMAGSQRVARYSNLSPGNYEFYLSAANADGVWSSEQKMLSFTIHPPWWKTWWAYALYFLLVVGAIWAFIAYRSRALKKENLLLEEKVSNRTAALNQSIESLKATQSQLIQSEKMASLGELTAGIAHEIQNPLNFINNFSEVNAELIEEMGEEIDKGNLPGVKPIADNIKENEQKILHHGKRADAIVKSMLQHSRSSSNKKEPTDINALTDEYLRLSFHGLRAKDKTFQANFETNFDPAVGKVTVVPQEIGRVVLNLLNNAFFAVTEKRKMQANGYEPKVLVSTKRKIDNVDGDKIEISISDNGNGIPLNLQEKIFQPFFTTKATGQGTGLGLSLSYDIITKGHNGKLNMKTKEGEGSEFIISIPVNQHE